MTISQLDKELKQIIDDHSVYGAECIINALVRACDGKLYLDEYALHLMLKLSFEHEKIFRKSEGGTENGTIRKTQDQDI